MQIKKILFSYDDIIMSRPYNTHLEWQSIIPSLMLVRPVVLGELKCLYLRTYKQNQRRSSRPPNPPIGGPRPTLGAQVSLKLLFDYVNIFSSADLFTTDLNCRKKLACDIISECDVILSRRI